VDVSRVAAGTQEETDPAWKTAEIVGRAVATMVESRAETTRQQARLRKTTRTFRKGRRFVWSVSSTLGIPVSLGSSELFCGGTSEMGKIVSLMFVCEEIAVDGSAFMVGPWRGGCDKVINKII